ncbi:glycosyltransferase family 2 protein [Parafrankia discariae]|uniref:glycosyltransferase family 2 protein n=1 Tax=Parafrankia discariae TaxID=365528 RepID=UPI00036B3EE3|nr:glycosyltransferase [Parafrankia discariae]
MTSGVTVVIPTIPPRAGLLARAVASASAQTLPPDALSVAVDTDRQGAWATRQRALDAVTTEWTAFLDDDDELGPHHIAILREHAESSGADYLYPWFVVAGGTDPLAQYFGQPWDDDAPHQTTIVTLVRTELAKAVGFREPGDGTVEGQRAGEDWLFTLGCIKAGAKIYHVPERTWTWHHHGRNTSGLPDRW